MPGMVLVFELEARDQRALRVTLVASGAREGAHGMAQDPLYHHNWRQDSVLCRS